MAATPHEAKPPDAKLKEDQEDAEEPHTINDIVRTYKTTYRYPDTEARAYKRAVKKELEGTREKRYGHLPPKYWDLFLAGCLCLSTGLWSEGAPPGHLKHYIMDLEPKPGVPLPAPMQPAKLSAVETTQERHHLHRELKLGHLVRPSGPVPTVAQVRLLRSQGRKSHLFANVGGD